jgi:hypothetical protein
MQLPSLGVTVTSKLEGHVVVCCFYPPVNRPLSVVVASFVLSCLVLLPWIGAIRFHESFVVCQKCAFFPVLMHCS